MAESTHARPQLRRRRSRETGFTLVEAAVATAIITIFVAGAVLSLVQLNRYAAISRLQTLAHALAQQRVDEILSTQWIIGQPRPGPLAPGTRTDANLPLNNDALNAGTGLSSFFTDLDVQVNASRMSEVTDLSTSQLRAVVTVTYSFRGRPYQVRMTTLRTSDNI